MELHTRRAAKRMRPNVGSSVADRTSASGSHKAVSQLPAFSSNNEAVMSTAQVCLASGSIGTHPWNTLVLDLQERILMHLPLQELGRAVCLGKAFCSAFQRRALQVEQGLTAAGVAAFGRPLLEGVGRVLQRYHQRTDLATGCGAMHLEQRVWIDRCGTVTSGILLGDSLLSRWAGREPYADVVLLRQQGTKDVIGAQDLTLSVVGPNCKHWAILKLSGPTHRSSARLRNEAAHLRVKYTNCLGAVFIIAQQAGEQPTCQNSGTSLQHEHVAHPVAPPFPGGGNPVQHAQRDSEEPSSGIPFMASQAILHAPRRRVAAGGVRRLCTFMGPIMQQASGDLVEQGMITALKLVKGFQVPCCQVVLGSNVRVFTCENKRDCCGH